MWFAVSIALGCPFEDSPIVEPIALSSGVRLQPVPSWVKNNEALQLLSWTDQEHVRDAELAFVAEYEADALGSPDPEWRGKPPRSIQSTVDETFALASLALWLVKPSWLTCSTVLHFSREGDAASLRQAGALRPILISAEEEGNVLTKDDLEQARQLLGVILALQRNSTIWIAIRMLLRAVTESMWEARYLLQWVVLEALFGPENPNETTYRLAQRIGLFVTSEPEGRRRLFHEAKEAYSWRSKIVHGRKLTKLTSEKSKELSATTENLIRFALVRVLTTPDYLRQFDSSNRDKFLDDLLFN